MRAKTIVLVAVMAFGAVLAHGAKLESGKPQKLDAGMTYDVNGTVEITGEGGGQKSGLLLEKGTAYINLKKGSVLKVTGANASGVKGAGAGIEVREDATLFITGEGELVATGGNAANGGEGGGGDPAAYGETNQCAICGGTHTYWGVLKAGMGGKGGNGGGGAGAGIGGCGGDGGNGGEISNEEDIKEYLAWRGRAHNDTKYLHDGLNGVNGKDGTAGGGMGRVVVTGMARVRVCGGKGGSSVTSYGTNGNYVASAWTSALNLYTAVGGGGGGGGAGGGAAAGIGGGGGGGGGGGSGGCGGNFEFNAWENIAGYAGTKPCAKGSHPATHPLVSGRGGLGGAGEKGGVCGNVQYVKHDTEKQHKNGDGGAGGRSAGAGGAGTVYVSLRAGLDDRTAWRYAPPPTSKTFTNTPEVEISFTDRGHGPNTQRTSFMSELQRPYGLPTRLGYRFAGWWTSKEEGNVCFYDQNNDPMMPYCDQLDKIALESRWEVDPSALVVTSNDDPAEGESPNDQAVTLRDAVKVLCDNPMLTGTNGARRITFALPKDRYTITLTRPIVIPAGTAPFEIFGLCGSGDGAPVVTLAGDGKTRLLEVNGEGLSLSHLMLTGARATSAGGAILCDDGVVLDVSDCAFFGNEATEGGAIGAKNGMTFIRNCTFAGNSATLRYGAVSAKGLAVALNTTFSENTAPMAKEGSSAAAALGLVGNGLVAHCTFARNDGSLSATRISNADAVTAVNCIFADGEGGTNGIARTLYSGVAKPAEAFAGGGLPVTNNYSKTLGVKHVWYEPRQCDQNFDAADIYYDGYSAASAITVKGVVTNVLFGTAAEATIPILADQLRSVRFAPVRGAIRIISGGDRPGVTLEGFYPAGKNGKHKFKARVRYDDPLEITNEITVATDETGFFSATVPVEGSDGTAHNAKSCRIEGLNVGNEWMAIATLPYAFTASSATALLTDDQQGENRDLELPGDAVTVNRAVVDSVSVVGESGWLEVASQSFSAGTVRGFGRIELAGVDVTEGRLDVLQDRNENGMSGALPYGNLAAMTANGENAWPFDNGTACVRGETTVAAGKTQTLDFGRSAAKGDGFVQIFVRVPANSGNRIGLKVGSVEVTPLGPFGSDGRTRRLLWTVPVRKGDVAELTLAAGTAEMSVAYQRQYMYFGVLSASELDDREK